jgi:hypothetical protein
LHPTCVVGDGGEAVRGSQRIARLAPRVASVELAARSKRALVVRAGEVLVDADLETYLHGSRGAAIAVAVAVAVSVPIAVSIAIAIIIAIIIAVAIAITVAVAVAGAAIVGIV